MQAENPKEVTRAIKYAGTFSLAAKIVGVLVQLISIPAIASSYNKESLAIWTLVATAMGIIQIFDLGIGNANMGLAAEVNARQGLGAVKRLLKTSLVLAGGTSGVGLLVALFIVGISSEDSLFQGGDIGSNTLFKDSLLAFLPVAFASVPVYAASQIAFGLHKGYWLGAAQCIGQIIYLIVLIIGVKLQLPIPQIIFLSYSALALANMFVVLQIWRYVANEPEKRSDDISVRALIRKSLPFLVIQLSIAISFNLDAFLIAKFVDIRLVPEFSLTQKIFYLPGLVISSYLNAIWPAYAYAAETKRYASIHIMFKRSARMSIGFAFLSSILLIFLAPIFFEYWTNSLVSPSYSLLGCFFFWAILNSIGGVQCSLLNGLGMISIQAKISVVSGMVNLLLSLLLVVKIGVNGPIIASLLTLVATYSIYAVIIRRRLREME
jgi:O-antigen/teichoic acid export membrane protein